MPKIECKFFPSIGDSAYRDRLWQIFQAAFAGCLEACVQDQICFSPETFAAALTDTDFFAFVLEVDGRPTGFLLMTDNLEKARVAYVNPERIRKLYPTEAAEKRLWYVILFAIEPGQQGQKHTQDLVSIAVERAVDKQAHFLFDYSTEKNSAMPHFLVRAVKRSLQQQGRPDTGAAYKAIGGQEYGIITLF